LRLTGYFLERWIFAPQDMSMPDARVRLERAMEKASTSGDE